MPEVIERIASLEATQQNNAVLQTNIYTMLNTRSQQHTELMSRLATIEEVNRGTKEYMLKCDSDRADIANKVAVIEEKQAAQKGYIAAMVTCISLAVPTIFEFFKKS